MSDLNLDKETLEFAIKKAWQFRFMCKDSVAGRKEAQAYKRIENVLSQYLEQIKRKEAVLK